jgi:protein-S-isoprenylcysteine O-methyltransferase Ste14
LRGAKLLFAAITIGFLYSAYRSFALTAWYFGGLLLCLIGLGFMWKAVFDLGDEFKAYPGSKRLVTTGIYTRFRHPTYMGLSLLLFGWAAMVQSDKLLSVAVVVTAVNISRAQLENEVLRKRFGKKYEEYENQVWF